MKLQHDLSVDFCGKRFINPFSIAASPPSDRRERIERAFEAGWAGAVFKTTSVEGEPVHLLNAAAVLPAGMHPAGAAGFRSPARSPIPRRER